MKRRPTGETRYWHIPLSGAIGPYLFYPKEIICEKMGRVKESEVVFVVDKNK